MIIHEQEIYIKPLSVNGCWVGRRFKTPEYKAYEKELMYKLKKKPMPEPPYNVEITLYMSNQASDIDNPVKPLIDILQKKFGFNDKHIMRLLVVKKLVKKGQERILFSIVNCPVWESVTQYL